MFETKLSPRESTPVTTIDSLPIKRDASRFILPVISEDEIEFSFSEDGTGMHNVQDPGFYLGR